MAVQYSITLRNDQGAAWENTIGASPKIQIRSGTQPANCAASATGTLVAEFSLGSDFATQANGTVSLSNLPISTTAAAANAGGAMHYRILNNAGSACHDQGTVTATGGGGDMEIDSMTVSLGQTLRIVAFSKTFPGA